MQESTRLVIKCIETSTRVFFAGCNFFATEIYEGEYEYYIIIIITRFFRKSSSKSCEKYSTLHSKLRERATIRNEYPNFFFLPFHVFEKPGLAINRDLIDRGPRPVTLPAANIPKTNVWSIQQSENEA